jgi:hypothetical protein
MEELLRIYEQYCEQVRHHQDERRTIANTLIVVIGALIAVSAIDQKLDSSDFPTAIAVIIIGLFGSACMIKCHGLIRFYKEVAANIATELTPSLPNGVTVKLLEEKTKDQQPCFWKLVDSIRLWKLWLLLFLLVTAAGILLVIFKL